MPDTPRTVSELKSLFADNSTGEISAQDLRDFVESVAEPVDTKLGQYVVARFNIGAQNAADNTNTYIEANLDTPPAADDPEGWFGSGTYDSPDYWGESFAEGRWWSLPEGTYAVFALVNLAANSVGRYLLSFVCIDNQLATINDLVVGVSDPAQHGVSAAEQTASGEGIRINGVFHVAADREPLAFVLALFQNSGDVLGISNGYLVVQRIA